MIYHIALRQDWEDATETGIYVCASLESQGFIHCSTADQVARVANNIFRETTGLKMLQITEDTLEFPLRYEQGEDLPELFPHVYGPINLEAVTQVIDFDPDDNGLYIFPEEFAHPKFWQETSLKHLTLEQWESLCDGCARCCLYKIQDIDTDELFYTNVACRFLEAETCRCTDYIHRHDIMPTCIILTPRNLAEIDWMPETCAYRLLNEGKPLRWWHPLNSHGPDSVRAAGISICGKYLPEEQADMDHLENYIVEDLQ